MSPPNLTGIESDALTIGCHPVARSVLSITPEFRIYSALPQPNWWWRWWQWALLGWRWEGL